VRKRDKEDARTSKSGWLINPISLRKKKGVLFTTGGGKAGIFVRKDYLQKKKKKKNGHKKKLPKAIPVQGGRICFVFTGTFAACWEDYLFLIWMGQKPSEYGLPERRKKIASRSQGGKRSDIEVAPILLT